MRDRNSGSIYELFGDNINAKKEFYEHCKNSDQLCDYDLERIAFELGFPTSYSTESYVHFSYGNVLDWLESKGYYIFYTVRDHFDKFVPVVHFKGDYCCVQSKTKIFSNGGEKTRLQAIEKGIEKAIEHYEKQK